MTWSFGSWGQANICVNRVINEHVHLRAQSGGCTCMAEDFILGKMKRTNKSWWNFQLPRCGRGQKKTCSCNLGCINREITRRTGVISAPELPLAADILCLVLTCWQSRDEPEKGHENHCAMRKPFSGKHIKEG